MGGLSDVGHAVLDAALGKGEELPVADLEAALERAEEQERKQDRRAEELRASGRGARWLREAERKILAGADRRPTLDEWGSVVGTAERRLRAHLDGLEAEIRQQAGGAALLRQLQSGRVGDGSSRLTLGEREDLIDSALRWLRAWERREKLFTQRDGKLLYAVKLDEFDPGWRDTGRVRIEHVEQALEHGEATLAGRARRAAALRERKLASHLGALRKHDVGEWLYAVKLDELAQGWRQTRAAAADRREQAIEWAERQVARIDNLRAHGAAGYLAEVGPAQVPSAVERAFDHAEGRLAARQREAAERARLEALDQEIARRRDEVLKASPAAGDALLLQAGFGESREKSVAALGEVEHDLAEDFARREQVLTAAGGAAFLEDARREVLGADRGHEPAWRQTGTRPADVDIALDRAEQDVDRRKPAGAEHEVVVAAEQAFPDTPSAAWRQAAERFPESSTQARAVSQRLSDRARVWALAAERAEPPSSPELVQRLFDWLHDQVEKLLHQLGLVKRVTRQSPASGAAQPAPATTVPARTVPGPAPTTAAIARSLDLDALAQKLEAECLPRHKGVLAASTRTMKALVRKLDAGDRPDYVARKALIALAARHRDEEEKRCAAEARCTCTRSVPPPPRSRRGGGLPSATTTSNASATRWCMPHCQRSCARFGACAGKCSISPTGRHCTRTTSRRRVRCRRSPPSARRKSRRGNARTTRNGIQAVTVADGTGSAAVLNRWQHRSAVSSRRLPPCLAASVTASRMASAGPGGEVVPGPARAMPLQSSGAPSTVTRTFVGPHRPRSSSPGSAGQGGPQADSKACSQMGNVCPQVRHAGRRRCA